MAAEHRPSVTNIEDALNSEKGPVYYDAMHVNGQANRTIAEVMYKELEPDLRRIITSTHAANRKDP